MGSVCAGHRDRSLEVVLPAGDSQEALCHAPQRDGEGQRRSGHQIPFGGVAAGQLDTAFGQSQHLRHFAGLLLGGHCGGEQCERQRRIADRLEQPDKFRSSPRCLGMAAVEDTVPTHARPWLSPAIGDPRQRCTGRVVPRSRSRHRYRRRESRSHTTECAVRCASTGDPGRPQEAHRPPAVPDASSSCAAALSRIFDQSPARICHLKAACKSPAAS